MALTRCDLAKLAIHLTDLGPALLKPDWREHLAMKSTAALLVFDDLHAAALPLSGRLALRELHHLLFPDQHNIAPCPDDILFIYRAIDAVVKEIVEADAEADAAAQRRPGPRSAFPESVAYGMKARNERQPQGKRPPTLKAVYAECLVRFPNECKGKGIVEREQEYIAFHDAYYNSRKAQKPKRVN